ncbi:hypothetical protein [Mumia zhuanghuii]|uniref:Secreted protein n=1 Tax=Mumia zhuanghuii TaxID=2585211 RepID=A0A5C4MIX2_9ACTN|nr:hypothetical protein [Mumia zhuanghuii]TNC36550.1 hypothetical protein FHE65_25925 [Mumia zhuanghuii]TNC42501.1 hypothetical protein FHE65_20980 [Mumia zhuanghuii]
MKTLSYRRPLRLAAALGALAVMASQVPGSAAEAPYPGLPAIEPAEGGGGGWVGVAQTAMTQVERAEQWVRLPAVPAAAFSAIGITNYPSDDPRLTTFHFRNDAFFVSPPGSKHNYGDMPPFRVRTVAFGTIPVEATVQISQQRSPDGLPKAFTFRTDDTRYRDGQAFFEDSHIADKLHVKILALRIDELRLPLTGRCETVRPAALDVTGKGGRFNSADEIPSAGHHEDMFFVSAGGRLSGTVDIPPFQDCVTSGGDDLSALLTAAVSGSDNPITLQVGTPTCLPDTGGETMPPSPGSSTLEKANCKGPAVPNTPPYPPRPR